MARNQIAKKMVDGTTVRFTFANGTVLELDVMEVPETARQWLTTHGASQKIGDSYAGVTDVAEAVKNADAVRTALLAGEVRAERGEGEGASLLAEALMLYFQEGDPNAVDGAGAPKPVAARPDYTIADARAALDKASDEQKRALRKRQPIVERIGRIQVERAKKLTAPAGSIEELFG